jgi:hypothetical protein
MLPKRFTQTGVCEQQYTDLESRYPKNMPCNKCVHVYGNPTPSITNSTLALSKSIPKPCYKQYTGLFKIDTEMTCYRQDTGVLKIDTEITSVLYIIVHSSQDRHCCIYIYICMYLRTRSSRAIKGEIKIDDCE